MTFKNLKNKYFNFFKKKEVKPNSTDVLILKPLESYEYKNNRSVKYRVINGISFKTDQILMQLEELILAKTDELAELKIEIKNILKKNKILTEALQTNKETIAKVQEDNYTINMLLHSNQKNDSVAIKKLELQTTVNQLQHDLNTEKEKNKKLIKDLLLLKNETHIAPTKLTVKDLLKDYANNQNLEDLKLKNENDSLRNQITQLKKQATIYKGKLKNNPINVEEVYTNQTLNNNNNALHHSPTNEILEHIILKRKNEALQNIINQYNQQIETFNNTLKKANKKHLTHELLINTLQKKLKLKIDFNPLNQETEIVSGNILIDHAILKSEKEALQQGIALLKVQPTQMAAKIKELENVIELKQILIDKLTNKKYY